GNAMLGRWGADGPSLGTVDKRAVRGRLNQLDERAGRVADNVGAYMSDAEVSGKIKSTMALDELVRARTIDVPTTGGVVTLGGTVRSIAERDQALTLARDTAGVTQVVDRLVVVPSNGT
ncbi:MAG: BON domain-containing protein, partial [Acidobacteria bacterium]|nr:BON domain-containing protein [Acidobacteriota bacterium]